MTYTFGNNGLIIIRNTIRYNGQIIPNPPKFTSSNSNVTQINNRLFINGWEYDFHNKKWKRTLKAIWHKFF